MKTDKVACAVFLNAGVKAGVKARMKFVSAAIGGARTAGACMCWCVLAIRPLTRKTGYLGGEGACGWSWYNANYDYYSTLRTRNLHLCWLPNALT